jgi:CubicO group peptidase (beta-lactamase class C family)
MGKKLVASGIVLLSIVVCSHGCGSEQSESVRNERVQRVENEIPRFSGPDPLAVLVMSFNNMLRSDVTRQQPRASLDGLMAEYRIPGVSLAVIDEYRIDWARQYGEIQAGRGIAVGPDTYFEAGSTTKMLTAALVMKLVEQGRLDLDRDANDYLESWRIPNSPLWDGKAVTLRLLLSHQSGLSAGQGFGTEDGKVPTVVDVLLGRAPATNAPAEMEAEPGTRWQYSNFGFVVTQLLLEDHLGRSYAELMQEYVFDPLGMKRSTFAHYDKKAIRDEVIVPHDAEGTPHERDMNPTIKAHGDLLTTPTDLATFTIELMKAYMGEPNGLFSRKTAREMLAVSRAIKPEEYFGLEGVGYGFGAMLVGENDAFYFMHPGSNNPGANCMLIANPGTGKGAVIMSNGEQGLLLGLQLVSSVALAHDWPCGVGAEPD